MPIDLFNELPGEIRLQIFRLATLKISQHEDTSVDYRPFEAVALRNRDWSSSAQRALDVKMTIILVCKEWKKIATEMLYECIRVGHGTDALLTALEGHADTPLDHGRWVRRIEISLRIVDFDPFNPQPLLRILERCPLAETVLRPCAFESGGNALGKVRLPPGTEFPTFPSVKRIDWWLPGVIPGPSSYSLQEPTSIPGFLGELVAHSPNLHYLTLSGAKTWRTFSTSVPIDPFNHPTYHNITTLRLESETEDVVSFGTTLSLPNLKHLVLGVNMYASARSILKTHGHLIRVLDLLDTVLPPHAQAGIVPSHYCAADVFAACPALEEFCAPLRMGTRLMAENTRVILKSLRCIRIKLDDSSPITSPNFGYFIRDKLSCPELEHMVLYGKSEAWKENTCYKVLDGIVSQKKFAVLEFA